MNNTSALMVKYNFTIEIYLENSIDLCINGNQI